MRISEGTMSRFQTQLSTMFELASQRTEGARLELVGMLADVFLKQEANLTLREQELVNELIDQLLLTNNSPALRARLVEKFADTARMPRKIAMSLACDSIDTAENVLIKSLTLT